MLICLFYFPSNLLKEKKIHFDSVPGHLTLLSEHGTPASPATMVRLQNQNKNICLPAAGCRQPLMVLVMPSVHLLSLQAFFA